MNTPTLPRIVACLSVSLFIPLGLAAPSNDDLSTAFTITNLPHTQQQDTTAASIEANEVLPECLNETSNSIWYQYTPNRNQSVVFDTFGSNYDTVLSIWSGTTHPLTQLACNDDSSTTSQSQVQIDLEPEVTYYLNISGYQGQSGTLVLNGLLINDLTNDDRANAIKIVPDANLGYSYVQSVQGASTEFREALASCAQSGTFASVWYRYTPPSNQRVVFNTIGSDYNTVLSIWTGKKHPLTEIACNDDSGMPQSQLAVELKQGTTYYLSVAAIQASSGSLSEPTGLLVFNMIPPPLNDDQVNAISITEPLPYTNIQYTGGATIENGFMPTCSPESSADIWYQFTPSTYYDGVTFSTAGSGYDTVLSIWQATQTDWLELACSDNTMATEQSNTSQLTIPLTENLTYYIDVSGVEGETGQLILHVAEAQRDFNIAEQPQTQTILPNQTATLTVELNNLEGERIVAGGNVANQWEALVALPISYQWYQGTSGDTSTPVGTNNHILTIPTLTTTTHYWVRISNPTGSLDSHTATITVSTTANNSPLANGLGIDTQGNDIPTIAHFTGQIASLTTGLSGNDIKIAQTETFTVNSIVDVDPNHIGEFAEIVIVGIYTTPLLQQPYMRHHEKWELWDWEIANLVTAEPARSLLDKIDMTIFTGNLLGIPGHFTVYVGYRLTNSGDIFYSGEPITFIVE